MAEGSGLGAESSSCPQLCAITNNRSKAQRCGSGVTSELVTPPSHINLAGHCGYDESGAAFLQEGIRAFGYIKYGLAPLRFARDVLDDCPLLLNW